MRNGSPGRARRRRPPDVLVVGGGVVGLSTAMFLAWHGTPVTLVERHEAPLRHPRARAVNGRTMELYRRVGLEQAVRAACSHPEPPGSLLLRAETLAGSETWRQDAVRPHGAGAPSPCGWAAIDQDRLECLVRDRAGQLGADLRFATTLRSFEVRGDSVTAQLDGPGGPDTVRARFLVAADGHRSAIRDRLGVGVTGPGLLGDTFTFLFEADLTVPLRGRHISVAHLDRPWPGTVLLPHDGIRRWVFSAPYRPGVDGEPGRFTAEDCARLVRAAVGVPELPVRMLAQRHGAGAVLAYQVTGQVADRFRVGPVFLAGDAAHSVPPTGAFGASTGIQDAHNVAWKLAAVLRGEAGAGLLSTYEEERRPVARFTLEQALLQTRARTGRKVPGSAAAPSSSPAEAASSTEPAELASSAVPAVPAEYDAVVFGYRYRSGAVSGADAGGPPALPPARLRAQPGTRAPHVEVVHDGAKLSTVDLYGPGWVLVAGPAGEAWYRAGAALAGDLPLAAYLLGTHLSDPAGDFRAAYGLPDSGAVLVRPDGFVAWRAESAAASPAIELRTALRRLLDPVAAGNEEEKGTPCACCS